MTSSNSTQLKSGASTATGVFVGGILGALLRCLVVIFVLGTDASSLIVVAPFILLPTAAFGFIAGAAGGWMAHPISGGIIGAIISGLFAELILSPCLNFVSAFTPKNDGDQLTTMFISTIVGMTVAGLIAGSVGGAISRGSSTKTTPAQPPTTPNNQPTTPAPQPQDNTWNSL
jgi:hypothetical protein